MRSGHGYLNFPGGLPHIANQAGVPLLRIGNVNPLIAIGFVLIILGVVGSLAIDSQIGYAGIISGWLVLMIDWQRQNSRRRQRHEHD